MTKFKLLTPIACAVCLVPVFFQSQAAEESLPLVKAARIAADFDTAGDLSHAAWQKARPVKLERVSRTGEVRAELSTTVRVLWSDKFLYLGYSCPFTKLTTFEPAELDKERIGLWDRDVVEAFINADAAELKHYTEFELSPNGEKLDLEIKPTAKSFEWSSGFVTSVKVDEVKKVWTAVMKIPLAALSESKPKPGDRWRINFYRCDKAGNAYLAWSPTGAGSFHVPEKFGVLEFEK
jgi:hypothetical protein